MDTANACNINYTCINIKHCGEHVNRYVQHGNTNTRVRGKLEPRVWLLYSTTRIPISVNKTHKILRKKSITTNSLAVLASRWEPIDLNRLRFRIELAETRRTNVVITTKSGKSSGIASTI